MIYKKSKLGGLATIKGGKRLPKGESFSEVITKHPYIRARDIGQGHITFTDPVYLTREMARKLQRYTVNSGDVCITIVGANVGDVGAVPAWLNGANLTENAVKVVTKNGVDTGFLKYALLTNDAQDQMKVLAGGAAQPKLGIYKVETVEIPFPSSFVQQKIAAILSAYDDLIENNLRRIRVLEEMAQNLYREWFVKFRFPGHEQVRMVDSPLGKIPEGWEVKLVKDFGEVITGKTPSKKRSEFYGSDIPFVKTPDMHGNTFVLNTGEYLSNWGAESQAKKTLPAGTISVSCIGTVGIVSILGQPSQTNQQINSIVLSLQQ